MGKMVFSLFLFTTLLFFSSSCTKELIGECPNNIKLSQDKVNFDSNSNTVTITANRDNWWINGACLDNNSLDLSGENTILKEFVLTGSEFQIERKGGR